MALTRKLLKGMGLTDEQVDTIIEAHTDTVDGLKADVSRYKADAEKLPTVQKELDDLKAAGDGGYKEKYEKEHKAFDDFKADITAKETKAAKEKAVKAYYESKNITGDNLTIALRGSGAEIDGVELDGDKIKDTAALDALVSGAFAKLVSTTTTKGANIANPPAGGSPGTMTKADIYKKDDHGHYMLSASERQKALMENQITEQERRNYMAATKVESLTNPRDSLPNTYTSVTAREVDFVTRFNDNWDALRNIMGIMRPIRKAPGTSLISYTADVALEDGDVGAGEVIPYSKATITQATKDDLSIKKYAKAVPIEDVDKYGAEIAVEKSDDAFLTKLQNVVLGNFYTFLNTGSLTGTAATWQAALAKAQGEVLNKFAGMAKDVTSVVGFANILDAYDYLGAADISVQTQFGLNYVKDFMGYSTLFLLPTTVSGNNAIARNTVIATPVENIDLYYADPGDSEFARLGLNYTVQGETNLIGFHAQGNYSTAVGESYAIMGMKLWAEYLDGIAKITVTPAP